MPLLRKILRLRAPRLIAALVLAPILFASGCAAFHPMRGTPVACVDPTWLGSSRAGKRTIDLSLLVRRKPAQHLVAAGDVLSIYIPGVLGRANLALDEAGEEPPINTPALEGALPTFGYPVTVRDDQTIALPYVAPVYVNGMTVAEVEQALRNAYSQRADVVRHDRILVSLYRPRDYQVLVYRQEASDATFTGGGAGTINIGPSKRGSASIVRLAAGENDVLHALAKSSGTNGLPGLDAENAIYIIRRRRDPAIGEPTPPGGLPTPLVPQPDHSRLPPVRPPGPNVRPTGFPGGRPAAPHPGPTHSLPIDSPSGTVYRGQSPDARQAPWGSHAGTSLQVPVSPAAYAPAAPYGAYADPAWGGAAGLPGGGGPPPADPYYGYGDYGHGAVAPPAGNDWSWAGLDGFDPTIENPNVVKIPVRLGPGEQPHITDEQITLYDGDIVFIESRDAEVFYTGGLLGGGQFTLPRDYDLRLLEAISVAEGRSMGGGSSRSIGGVSALNRDVTISPSQVIVLRRLPDGSQLPIEVDIYRAQEHPEENIIVQPGDYLMLQYTCIEAVGAFIERHLLEGALFGVASASLNSGGGGGGN